MMVEQGKVFYMVYGEGGAGATKRHDTHLLAQQEAQRLAIKQPGTKFYVLQAYEYHRTSDTPVMVRLQECLTPPEPPQAPPTTRTVSDFGGNHG